MEFKQLFGSMGIVLIAIIAIFGLFDAWSGHYGVEVDGGLTETRESVSQILTTNLSSISEGTTGSIQPDAGSASSSSEEGLIKRSLNSIKNMYTLIDLTPTVVSEGGRIFGISPQIIEIFKWIFGFAVALTLAYMFILGVKTIRGLF